MYVQVEFRVIEALANAVARAANVNEDRVLAGLNRLWHWAWSQKSDVINLGQLAGLFGGERIEALADGLVGQDFLEAHPNDWRIKGAERYLRIRKTRSDNAKRTNEKRWKSDDGASQVRRNSDASATQPVALTLNTDTLSTEHLEDLSPLASEPPPAPKKRKAKAKPQAALPLEPTPEGSEEAPDEEPERKLSKWEEAFEGLQAWRMVACNHAGVPFDVEGAPARKINAMLSGAARTLTALAGIPIDDADGLEPFFESFASMPRFASYDPPWPIEAFCHPKNLEGCLELFDQRIADAKAAH